MLGDSAISTRSEDVPELWGGFECTTARIGDACRDEIVETGHRGRADDLDRLAALGIRTLRYPALWETVAPEHPDEGDWQWLDARFARIARLGLRPIVGLVHHGSGPRYTNLLDDAFPTLLAAHAARVAARYPWVEDYTPVNEPLTTARFSALYGHWYPHRRDMGAFLRALVIQCKATLLAMRAIRRIVPRARLVQTEDLGKVWSVPSLADQASFENERRWLSFDLLCGRVDAAHPFHRLLRDHGVREADLALLGEGEGAPDVIGINHYPTSERFLDLDRARYPAQFHGGNGMEAYADVEAVRVHPALDGLGPKARLREAWERYRRPLAVTEVHHGSWREEQLRWLAEVWEGARALRREGADVRAVTVWSAVGAVDWNSLLVERRGFYEPGAFDIRAPEPRPTALARAAVSLVRTGTFSHPVLNQSGWWKRDDRYYHPQPSPRAALEGPPLLILGRNGTLGQAFARICAGRGLKAVVLGRHEADFADPRTLAARLRQHRPWAVIDAAGYVRVAEAARQRDACFAANAHGPARLAELCAAASIQLLAFSSDRVFDGRLGRPYRESDTVRPVDVYGESKALMERLVLAAHPDALVVRTSAFFGPWDEANFAFGVLRDLTAGRRIAPDPAVTVSPTYVPDLVHASLDLLIDGERGIWHLANAGARSWAGFAQDVARTFGLAYEARTERNPGLGTALTSARGLIMPGLDDALERFGRESRPDWRSAAPMAAE